MKEPIKWGEVIALGIMLTVLDASLFILATLIIKEEVIGAAVWLGLTFTNIFKLYIAKKFFEL